MNISAVALNVSGAAWRVASNRTSQACAVTARACAFARILPRRVLCVALVLLALDRLAKWVAPGYYHHLDQQFPDSPPPVA